MAYKEPLLSGAPASLIIWYPDINATKGPMGPTFAMFEHNWQPKPYFENYQNLNLMFL